MVYLSRSRRRLIVGLPVLGLVIRALVHARVNPGITLLGMVSAVRYPDPSANVQRAKGVIATRTEEELTTEKKPMMMMMIMMMIAPIPWEVPRTSSIQAVIPVAEDRMDPFPSGLQNCPTITRTQHQSWGAFGWSRSLDYPVLSTAKIWLLELLN